MGDWGWRHVSVFEKQLILAGLRDGSCHGGPYHCELQLSDRCSLNCGFCCSRRFRSSSELKLELVRRIARELKESGCHSITLNGGGEPLGHSRCLEALETIVTSGLKISGVTTNGVHLGRRVAKLLVSQSCGQVIISLNTAGARNYSAMMGTSEKTYWRVLDNIARLLEERNGGGSVDPVVVVQFLIHRGNSNVIEKMYQTASDLGVDRVLFNDITGAHWRLDRESSEAQRAMAGLRSLTGREGGPVVVMQSHNYQMPSLPPQSDRGAGISSRLAQRVGQLSCRLSGLSTGDFPRLLHAPLTKAERVALREVCDCCIAPWYTLTIRPNGEVPVCCALQDRVVGNVAEAAIGNVWYGNGFGRVRSQIRETIAKGRSWKYDGARDTDIIPGCSPSADPDGRCRFRSYYYSGDWPFLWKLRRQILHLRCVPPPCDATRQFGRRVHV